MNSLDSGRDKLKKICTALRVETLEPAKQKAREIEENAYLQAKEILAKAEKEAENIRREAQKEVDQKKKLFESSLHLAFRQSIDALKLKIEKQIFTENLGELVTRTFNAPEVVAQLITAILQSIEKEGIDGDVSVFIAKDLTPRSINELLAAEFLKRIKEGAVQIGGFESGVQVKLQKYQVTIDITQEALLQLLVNFIHQDFREFIFHS